MGVEVCPLKGLDDLALRQKTQELKADDGGQRVRCLQLLIDRGLRKDGATTCELQQFVVDIFCTPNLPIGVLQYACRLIIQRPDHHLFVRHALQGILEQEAETHRHLLYSLDALMSMPGVFRAHSIPADLRTHFRVHQETFDEPYLCHGSEPSPSTMTDEELHCTFLFHTYAKPGSSCRRCLRQSYAFWRSTYPLLRPGWMQEIHVRPVGLQCIETYQQWFQQDQELFLASLDAAYNDTDPWSLDNTADTPFYLLQRTTKHTAKFQHLFPVFALKAHFTATKEPAADPYNRSPLGSKNEMQCSQMIERLRNVAAHTMLCARRCGPSITSCRKE